MTTTDLYYDPYDYSIDSDPYPIWKRLRDEAPVYRNEKLGFYALSRYDDVLTGLLDQDTFVSSHGIVLEMMADEPLDIPMMIMMDPPVHTRLRKLVNRAFTPRAMDRLTDRVTRICADLLDPLVGEAGFDFITHYAGVIPPTVILALVGFPEGYAAAFRQEVDSSSRAGCRSSGCTPTTSRWTGPPRRCAPSPTRPQRPSRSRSSREPRSRNTVRT